MSEAYIGEIRIFAGNYPPKDWAFCNGQLLPIAQNTALFSILGVQYGGDGKTNFALPNLLGRAPMHQGDGAGLTPRSVGEQVGTESVTLLINEIPTHTHVAQAVAAPGSSNQPDNQLWAETPKVGRPGKEKQEPLYDATVNAKLNPAALDPAGGSQPHNNMQPFLVLNYIICLQGEFPARD